MAKPKITITMNLVRSTNRNRARPKTIELDYEVQNTPVGRKYIIHTEGYGEDEEYQGIVSKDTRTIDSDALVKLCEWHYRWGRLINHKIPWE